LHHIEDWVLLNVLMFHEIAIFFYHNLNFLFHIFLTRICFYSEYWLWICAYNLHQRIKNDTDSTNVIENDYMHICLLRFVVFLEPFGLLYNFFHLGHPWVINSKVIAWAVFLRLKQFTFYFMFNWLPDLHKYFTITVFF
jgi:hypothetical protein